MNFVRNYKWVHVNNPYVKNRVNLRKKRRNPRWPPKDTTKILTRNFADGSGEPVYEIYGSIGEKKEINSRWPPMDRSVRGTLTWVHANPY